MAWPPTTDELRQEITTKRSDDSLHRILQAAVDVVHPYGLSDAISENMSLQLAVTDVKFDALDMEERDGIQLLKAHERTRNGILIELGRLRRRAVRGLGSAGAPSVPAVAEAPTAHTPISYLPINEFLSRYPSTTPPKTAKGEKDRSRLELLLDDAAAWCASVIPGNLVRGGAMLPVAGIPPALLAVCKQVSSDLVTMWLSPRRETYAADCAKCEQAARERLEAVAQASAVTTLPPVSDVYHLLVSEDDTFTLAEVVVSDHTRALTLPEGTIPAGESRYLAYARPASEGDYTYLYLYPPGARNTHNQIVGWEEGDTLQIGSVDCLLLQTRIQYSDVANGTVFEAGDAATEPVTPVVPTTTATRYLLAGEDDTFSAAEEIVSGTDAALVVPDGTVPDGETRWFAYARIAGAGSYQHAYLYPADFPNTLNQIGAFVEGPELEINGVAYLLLRARVDYSALVNTRVLECD